MFVSLIKLIQHDLSLAIKGLQVVIDRPKQAAVELTIAHSVGQQLDPHVAHDLHDLVRLATQLLFQTQSLVLLCHGDLLQVLNGVHVNRRLEGHQLAHSPLLQGKSIDWWFPTTIFSFLNHLSTLSSGLNLDLLCRSLF